MLKLKNTFLYKFINSENFNDFYFGLPTFLAQYFDNIQNLPLP